MLIFFLNLLEKSPCTITCELTPGSTIAFIMQTLYSHGAISIHIMPQSLRNAFTCETS